MHEGMGALNPSASGRRSHRPTVSIFALLVLHHLSRLAGAYQLGFHEPVDLFLFLDNLNTGFIVIQL